MRIRFLVFLMLAAAFSAFAQSGEWYQGKPIKDIVFEGLKHINQTELAGVVESFIGKPFTDENFWELQGRLYALEYFDMISPTAVPSDAAGSEVIIKFAVTERPIVSRINFVGNSTLRRNELMDVISLKVNDVANQLRLRIDEAALRNKYLEKGFPDVSIRAESVTNDDNTIAVTFYINEGDRITIEGFQFEGNSTFSDRTLRGQLSLKTKGILNDGAFQEAKLVADRNSITQYYHDRGYIDAAVTDVVRDVRRDDKGNNIMILGFKIYEGRIYNFGGVEFVGNEIFSTEQLNALVSSKPGQVVNARRVEADLQRVADLYYENGYIFNSISREEVKNSDEGTVSYRISIIERGRAHIENIVIRGNKKTKDFVILREIDLEPGDVFSKTKVMDAMRNLYNLQYFSMVAPDTPPGSVDSLMNLVFTVEEQPTTDLQLGVTFSGTSDPDTFPISGVIKWNDRNFMGYGNSLGAELSASPDTQYLTLEYTKRWLFGLPLSGGFDFTVRHAKRGAAMNNYAPFFNGDETYAYPDGFESYDEYVDASKLPDDEYLMDYNQWSLSLGFSTGYRFSTFLGNLSLGGSIRAGLVRNVYDEDMYRPFDPTLREGNNQWVPSNSISASISLDQRDIYYDPSKGYYAIQRFGFYGIFPVEREHYIRSDTKAEFFATLFNIPVTETYSLKMVFGIHTGVSFLLPQFGKDDATVESSNQLSVDGTFIGRGWTNERYNRGLALWENWAELRLPVIPGILALDGFFDAAAMKETPEAFFNDFKMEDMRFSFGAGLRFALPQFPFRFIFAKRFKVVDGQVEWQSGSLWKRSGKPNSGIDFIISFALSSY
ncbi:outer membrane protein assembly factor BamA [Breznakiella homolactica]|uniref:Outer membrane protein assembly factor BamA n=1 Tax=Breznakiella homolactica TaxID=2798577 RepID=A0A7T7XKZ9_9SPIR|nr:outer membrane protein assembly factor BamA [Breznakiella homolactica]QQO08202.1 outer membrane protein assembly factor BamA [Breznakiella homolactica]